MSMPAAKQRLSVADFLAFAETQDQGHYELLLGEIVAMAPQRAEHGRAKFQICRALADALKAKGAPCEAFIDSIGVAIDDETFYLPDVLVNCGERLAPESLIAPAPVILVEILSPSSGKIDKELKLADYFRLPSLVHYLIVDLKRRFALHYRRGADGAIAVAVVKEGAIALDPPGVEIACQDMFG